MLCIKNGRLVMPGGIREADLYIRGGKIFSVGGYWAGAEEADARGCYVFPGFIDSHVHLGTECARVPTADDYESGTEAALLGGTTSVLDFAAQRRGDSLLEAMETWGGRAVGHCHCDYGFHMAITDWNRGTLRELRRLATMGVTSYKAFMAYPALRLEDKNIERLLRATADIGFVGVHCELGDEIERNVAEALAAGHTDPAWHGLTRPAEVEALAVRRALELAREAGTPVWIVHLSTAQGLEEIRQARRRGQFVLAETCPHYLTLTDELLRQPPEESAKYVCSPPLRTAADCEALWKGLAAGEIQLVSTDHCSFTAADKQAGARTDFTRIPNGLPSIEYRAALLWTEGVARGRLTPEDMARVLAEFPAKSFGLYPRKGVLRAGSDADVVIWDPNWRGAIRAADSPMRAGYSPWEGLPIRGRARSVYLRGALTASQGTLLRFGQGEYLERDRVFAE